MMHVTISRLCKFAGGKVPKSLPCMLGELALRRLLILDSALYACLLLPSCSLHCQHCNALLHQGV